MQAKRLQADKVIKHAIMGPMQKNKIKKLFASLVLTCLISFNYAIGQTVVYNKAKELPYRFTNNDEIRELNIGDQVPDFEFELLNHTVKKAKLSDFKGKFILIDFWATWCTSCLRNFPKMDSLQQRFGEQLQFLLVNTKGTQDDEIKINSFFNKRKAPSGKKYQLPSTVGDTIIETLFPHKIIPHYVWIDDKGVVQAITSSDQITIKNVESFIRDKSIQLPRKIDLNYDVTMPLFIENNGGSNDKYIYRSILTGYLEGLPSSSGFFYNEDKKVIRILNINTSLLGLCQQAYPKMSGYPQNRIHIKSKKRIKYIIEGSWDSWRKHNAVTYELIVPPMHLENALNKMKEDIKRYFDLTVTFKRIKSKCLVLKFSSKQLITLRSDSISENNLYERDEQQKFMRNQQLSQLVSCLNSLHNLPVVDETHFLNKVSIEGLPGDLTNLKLLRDALKKYGLEITEEIRKLNFWILSEQ